MTVLADNPIRTRDNLRFNLAPDSRSFDCDFIEPGIISYRDQGGGIELLRKETIDRCLGDVVGVPLTIGHEWVTAENRMELENGIVQECYFDPVDGKYHAKGSVDTPRAQQLMKLKRPSIGYAVTSFGPGGTYHGIRYDKEITGLKFNHLAIVDKPRYEQSTFRLNSIVSNPSTNMKVFKFLKSLVTRENGADGNPVETKKVETVEHSGETEVMIEINGKETPVRLNDLAEVWMAQTKAAVESGARVNGDDEVEIDGKKVKMNELVDCYKAHGKRENAAPAAPAAAAPVVTETPEQKTAREAAEKNQRTNSFFTLRNAATTQPATDGGYSTSSGSMSDKLKRGSERY